jgi:hypothetical protein
MKDSKNFDPLDACKAGNVEFPDRGSKYLMKMIDNNVSYYCLNSTSKKVLKFQIVDGSFSKMEVVSGIRNIGYFTEISKNHFDNELYFALTDVSAVYPFYYHNDGLSALYDDM